VVGFFAYDADVLAQLSGAIIGRLPSANAEEIAELRRTLRRAEAMLYPSRSRINR
jgi:hypothetical protein